MKKVSFAKKRNKLVSALAAGIVALVGLVGTTLPASAEDLRLPKSIEEEIFEVCLYQCTEDGIELTSSEKENMMNEIVNAIRDCSDMNGCTYSAAGESILAEMIMETGYGTQSNSGINPCCSNEGNTQLPTSKMGDIFFADNTKAWNHVGMYTDYDRIIEAMPAYGVHEVSIYNSTALQETVDEDHDESCILRVKGVSDGQIEYVVWFAEEQIGKEYDGFFPNNKTWTELAMSKFNCSELVWKAYYFSGGGTDLDSNGGLAVYPNNIYNSDKVEFVKKF